MTLVLVGYLALAALTGFALTFVSRMPWQLEGRLAMGIALGLSAAAMLTWLVAIPFGMSGWMVLAGAVLMVAMVAACLRFTEWRQPLRGEAMAMARRWRRFQALPLLLVLVPAGLFFVPFYLHALEMRPDGLWAGYVNIWGDWCTHLSMAGYLSHARDLLPPQNPFFTGVKLTYPFLPDLFSGMLLHLGLDLPASLPLASAIMSLALVVIFFSTAARFTGSNWAAMLGTMVFFLSGGLGFLLLFGEIHPSSAGVLAWLGDFGNQVLHPSIARSTGSYEYTLDRKVGYQWLTPILAYLVPQRTTLFGFSLGLFALSVLWYGRSQRSRREMVIAGVVLGLTPLFHASTYFDLMLVVGGICAIDVAWPTVLRAFGREGSLKLPLPHWAAFFAPALALGLPQVFLILPPAGYHPQFLTLEPGWLSGWSLPQGLYQSGPLSGLLTPPSTDYRLTPVVFWLLNTALLIPLALLSLYARTWGKPGLRRFLLPAWILFLLPNFVILQPWDWDNTKWFIWWAILASMLAGLVLFQLFRRGPAFALLAIGLLAATTFSGFLDVNRASQKDLANVSFRLLDNDELAVAAWARQDTPQDTIFLTGWKNDHPILTMSRRAEVMGYPGWLWTWGLSQPVQRQQDVVSMYRGDDTSAALLKQYRVSYVVIGPQEQGPEIRANVPYYQNQFPMVYQSPTGEYQVYKIS
jgi:hypothetical protein